jgi:hypothetical protein
LLIQASRKAEIAGIREEIAFRTKKSTREEWPILKCIALSMKIFCITNILAGSF